MFECKKKIIQLLLASPIKRIEPKVDYTDLNKMSEKDLVELFDIILEMESKYQKEILKAKLDQAIKEGKYDL